MNRPTAIVADDSPTFLMYFSTLLNRMNYDVLPVRSGEEAYDLARIVAPGLISLDVVMPGESGLETLQRIRNDTLLAKTPVIMVSGDGRFAEACFSHGCCGYLTKPIELPKMHDALQKCQPRPENRRKHLRAPMSRIVSYCVDGRHERSYAVSLSEGGIYLRTTRPHPVGTRIEVDLPLSDRESMVLCGKVIYTKGLQRGRFMIPPGMAVGFDDCRPDMQKRLREEVIGLLVGDMIAEQDEEIFRRP